MTSVHPKWPPNILPEVLLPWGLMSEWVCTEVSHFRVLGWPGCLGGQGAWVARVLGWPWRRIGHCLFLLLLGLKINECRAKPSQNDQSEYNPYFKLCWPHSKGGPLKHCTQIMSCHSPLEKRTSNVLSTAIPAAPLPPGGKPPSPLVPLAHTSRAPCP